MPKTKKPLHKITPVKERLKNNSVLNHDTGCIEWTGALHRGYGRNAFRDEEGKWFSKYVHRVAYEEYVEQIPSGMCVCHRCDNPKCINPEHLFLGTNKENTHDKINKGRENYSPVRGEKSGQAKLTEKQVILIKQLYNYGITQKKIASEFGVAPLAIRSIVNGKTWRHVKWAI